MKNNMISKISITVLQLLSIACLFLPLIVYTFLLEFNMTLSTLFSEELNAISQLGGDDTYIRAARIILILIIVLNIMGTSAIWLVGNRKIAFAPMIASIYQIIISAYLIASCLSYDEYDGVKAGIGLWLLLIFGVGTFIFSMLLLLDKAEKEHAISKSANTISTAKNSNVKGAIIATAGDYSGASIPVGSEGVTIGRNSNVCNIVLKGNGIGRKHCIVRYNAEKRVYEVFDDSTNGTFLAEGDRLPKGTTELQPGTSIRIGENVFRLQ